MSIEKSKQNSNLAKTQQKFFEFYQKNLQSVYKDLEQDRRENLFALGRNTAIILGIALIFAALFCHYGEEIWERPWLSWVVTGYILAAIWMLYYPFMRYNGNTKSRTMDKILSFWGDFKSFNGIDLIGKTTIKASELFNYFNKSVSEDAFFGVYKEVGIKVSEHDLRIKGNRGDTVIFDGVMIQLKLPDRFKGKTVVLNKGRKLNILWNNPLFLILLTAFLAPIFLVYYYYFTEPGVPVGLLFTPLPILFFCFVTWVIYRIYRHFHPKKATQKVALEGLPFMRRWTVLTDNQVEARYVLTPVFMEKMLEIKRLFHGKQIDFSFFGSTLLIAVHTRKNMFETTSLFLPALSYHKVREVVGQLQSIFDVIDVVLENH